MLPEPFSWIISWSLMLVIGLGATLALMGCETTAPSGPAPLATSPVPDVAPAAAADPASDDPAAQAAALAARIAASQQAGSYTGQDAAGFSHPPLVRGPLGVSFVKRLLGGSAFLLGRRP